MEGKNPKKFQLVKLFLIAALLIITPLISKSHRSTYLYFIVNAVIIAVGAEAGLLSFFLKAPENKKINSDKTFPNQNMGKKNLESNNGTKSPSDDQTSVKKRTVCSSDKILGPGNELHRSIFFIDGGESCTDGGEEVEVEEDGGEAGEAVGELSGQELFQKSENFIGNFYKQLKMQREESWKKLQDLIYQKK